jgi:hypothetical protein
MKIETCCFLPHEDGMYVLSYGQQVLLPVYTFTVSGIRTLKTNPEAEFLDVIGTKVLRVFLLAYLY